jgi:hypothetical protein
MRTYISDLSLRAEGRRTAVRIYQELITDHTEYRHALMICAVFRASIAFAVFFVVVLSYDVMATIAVGVVVVLYCSLEMFALRNRIYRAKEEQGKLRDEIDKVGEVDPQLAWLEVLGQLQRLARQQFEREAKWDPSLSHARLERLAKERVNETVRDFLSEWLKADGSEEAQEQFL